MGKAEGLTCNLPWLGQSLRCRKIRNRPPDATPVGGFGFRRFVCPEGGGNLWNSSPMFRVTAEFEYIEFWSRESDLLLKLQGIGFFVLFGHGTPPNVGLFYHALQGVR
jgi:hypothetical protein